MASAAKNVFEVETVDELRDRCKGATVEDLMQVVVSQYSTIENLKKIIWGKAEKRTSPLDEKAPLFDEVEVVASGPEDQPSPDSPFAEGDGKPSGSDGKKKKRGKRKPLSKDLPRVRVEHDLSDKKKVCPVHGTQLDRIGEKVSEQLEITPAKVRVIQNVTFAYKCPCCSSESDKPRIVSSTTEPQPIPKSIATPSLLAYIGVSKYQDALPLARLEKIFSRYGIELDRTTMARWVIQASELAQPLINFLAEDLMERKAIGCDETPVQVLKEENRRPQQSSYMWVTCSMEGPPIALFHYYENRSAKVAESILAGYKGVIVCDGLKSYNAFANAYGATLAGCLAHVRRKFHSSEKAALRANPKGVPRAKTALDWIKALSDIEREVKDDPPDKTLKVRQEKSKPIMDEFRSWLDQLSLSVLPKSLLGKAVGYALDQWDKMLVFLDNPHVPTTNNQTERYIRPFVIGRGNWMFSRSPAGAHASATLYSLVETAKANGIEPFDYLSLVFRELPKASSADDYEKLLPYNVGKHFDLKPYTASK